MELGGVTELTTWHERGTDIRLILDEIGIEPDFILILEYYETNATRVSGLRDVGIPFAVSMEELHYDIDMRKELIINENIKHIFTSCTEAFCTLYPEFMDRMIPAPQHVNTNIFKDYGLPKTIDYLLMGQEDPRYYPLRHKIVQTMQDKAGFVFHRHPGYREFKDDEDLYVKEKYAREINRAKMFFTCNTVSNYVVAKYFEAPACNTLLMAPTSPGIEYLGFEPGVNFVNIDNIDFMDKAEYYLAHEEERRLIARSGYEMVRARHSTARRAAEYVEWIESIIGQDKKRGDHK